MRRRSAGCRQSRPGWGSHAPCLDDPVAGLALVAGFLDEASGGAVRRVGAVPHLRPGQDAQGGAGHAAATGLDQVELARGVLVRFAAFGAEIQGHGDVAVEGNDALLQVVGVLDDFVGVGHPILPVVVPGRAGTDAEGGDDKYQQAQIEGFLTRYFDHCYPSRRRLMTGSGPGVQCCRVRPFVHIYPR